MWRALALTVALVGCGGGDDETDSADTGDDEGETEVFAPSDGTWTVDTEQESGTCDFPDEDTGDPGTDDDDFTITDNGDGTFRVYDAPVGDDPGIDVICTLTDMDFVCEENAPPPQPVEGLDASLVMVQNLTGSFSDASTLAATSIVDVSCEGADCALLAEIPVILPCSLTVEITASFSE